MSRNSEQPVAKLVPYTPPNFSFAFSSLSARRSPCHHLATTGGDRGRVQPSNRRVERARTCAEPWSLRRTSRPADRRRPLGASVSPWLLAVRRIRRPSCNLDELSQSPIRGWVHHHSSVFVVSLRA